MYKLTTQTLPVLTYLKNWDKLFESPFKSDVYFFSTRLQIGRKWGTAQPITIRDKDFGMVRLRAFGCIRTRSAIREVLHRDQRHARRVHARRSGRATAQPADRHDDEHARRVVGAVPGHGGQPDADVADDPRKLAPEFERYGVALDNFAVTNVSCRRNCRRPSTPASRWA
jgi:hypothetical protein